MTVSVVFAIAGVIALLFGVVGGGIKAREIEVPLLPFKARIITIIVGVTLLGVTVWLESGKPAVDEQVSNIQSPSSPPTNIPSIVPTAAGNLVPATGADHPNSDALYARLYEAKTWDLVVQESFDNNDNNWVLWNVDDVYKTETMEIHYGVFTWGLKTKTPDTWYLEVAPLSSYSNIYYSVKMKRIGKPTGDQVNNQAIWGVVFRRQGGDFYSLLLNDLQEYALSLHTNAGWTALVGQTRNSQINLEKSNELTVIADGSEITFFINGVPIKTITDSTFAEGNVGLYAGLNYPDDEVKFEIDDFEVRQKP